MYTIEEFKEYYPEYAHLEGDELWNKMEDELLKIQDKVKGVTSDFWAKNELKKGWPLVSYKFIIFDISDKK